MDHHQQSLWSGGGSSPAKRAKLDSNTSETRVNELENALRPVLETLWDQNPESLPFRQPVDPVSVGIQDCSNLDFIKEPMDLSTISNKLESGKYKTPWEFCKDVWLMFDNAWLYNKRTSQVYKYCTKLRKVFDSVINEAMQNLGYCCGMKYAFHPQVLYCYGKPLCIIPRDTPYYSYQNSQFVYCQQCFIEMPGDTITLGDDPLTATVVRKSAFKEMKNDAINYELMVECIHCGREMHKACVLHHENIWPDGFQCKNCLKAKHIMLKDNKFSAKCLPTTELALHLEDRINHFLQAEEVDAGTVTIRVVFSSDKVLDTHVLMRNRFQRSFPESFPYRAKAIVAFQEIDGIDVCFFGIHVQEYGSDCQAPNTRRVYISYLDSIHFFQPCHLRTFVHHEILLGYLEFCKNNGYLTAHIWVCPPSEGDDYLFYCHPVDHVILDSKELIEWLREMLDSGKANGVVYDYQDIFQHCIKNGVTSVTGIPYFDGDFWPNVIEESIKEIYQENREREPSNYKDHGPKKAGKFSSNMKRSKKKRSKKNRLPIGGDDLSKKLFQTMEKLRELFFVVLLQPPQRGTTSPLPETTDPDYIISCDLMDGREAFLTMAQERHWEFSSLCRAKYSTMAMLYELHKQISDHFMYTCSHCHLLIETSYHCQECNDFVLCVTCYHDMGHIHTMNKLGLGLDDEIQQDPALKDPREQCKAFVQKCIQFLVHASQCCDVKCTQPGCIRMKRILRHTRDCELQVSENCITCKQFLSLCYSHAKNCNNDECPVPVCPRIKKNLREQRAKELMKQNHFMQQRMATTKMLSNSYGNHQTASTQLASQYQNQQSMTFMPEMESHVMAAQQHEVLPPEVVQDSHLGPTYQQNLAGVSQIQPQMSPMVMQPRTRELMAEGFVYPQRHLQPQLIQVQYNVQDYQPVQYSHQIVPQGQQQMYEPHPVNPVAQQHPPSQPQTMLVARQLAPQHQGITYVSMAHHPDTLDRSQRYLSAPILTSPSPQTPGYFQVVNHQVYPMPTYSPLVPSMSPAMHPGRQMQYTEHGMPVDHDEMNALQVTIQDLVIKSTPDSQIGTGSFGNVLKGTRSGHPCAVKVLHGVNLFLPLQSHINSERLERFESECKFLEQLQHPNIVQYFEKYIHPGSGTTMLAMELMDENLSTFLTHQRETCDKKLSECIQIKICKDVAHALSYLHSFPVVHRDLSSNNILLSDSTQIGNCQSICAKVSDFGISRLIDSERFHKTLSTIAPGTKGYMPPESWINHNKYNEKFDIFSFGVLVVQIITMLPPNPSDRAITVRSNSIQIVPEVKRREDHLRQIEGHPLQDLTFSCLQDDTTVRPTASEICEFLQQLTNSCSCV